MTTDTIRRHHVNQAGQAHPPMVFAHGFGCDQQMWRFVAPAFEATHRVVLFDHIGCGKSDLSSYDGMRHSRLEGYAEDVVALFDALDLRDVVFVGHSVSAMIGVLAAIARPERFAQLVLVGPSPRYLNDPDAGYVGGFERADIDGLIDLMDSNQLGWADCLAPVVMGAGSTEALTDELKASFCAADPYINRRFAMATFLGDNRADLPRLTVPTLILQCAHDAIAPCAVGDYMHAHMPGSRLRVLDVAGHCPHLTHPQVTIDALRAAVAGG
ncbi:MAG: alpha/beta hydrolase [Aquabacterium sp.]|nr:alpha/beta hydrolase [Aquabacterium sp.]